MSFVALLRVPIKSNAVLLIRSTIVVIMPNCTFKSQQFNMVFSIIVQHKTNWGLNQ